MLEAEGYERLPPDAPTYTAIEVRYRRDLAGPPAHRSLRAVHSLSLSLPYGLSTSAKARAELSERLPMKRNSVGACDLPPPPGPGRG